MNKEKLLELSDTLRGIADGKEWEIRKWTWFSGVWDTPEGVDPFSALEQGYEIRLKPQQPQPDPYAELKAARAAGETIQCKQLSRGDWLDTPNPTWSAPASSYRIKPEPQKLPLSQDDVKAGDEFLAPNGSRYQWTHLLSESVGFDAIGRTYNGLMHDGWRIRSIGETEWRPCYKLVEQ